MNSKHTPDNTPENQLASQLDALGSQLRSETPKELEAQIQSAVQTQLDSLAPRPISIGLSPQSSLRMYRWVGGAAAAAALMLTAVIAFNPFATQPSSTTAASNSQESTGIDSSLDQLADEVASQDLGDWLASMSLGSDDSIFEPVLTGDDGSSNDFWTTDAVLAQDASVF